MKILFITQNLAPFRIAWLEALANYSKADITVMYLGQYESITQKEYKNVKSTILTLRQEGYRVGKIWLYHYNEILNEAHHSDAIIVDGYGFLAQIIMIFFLRRNQLKFILSADGGIMPQAEKKIKYTIKKKIITAATAYFSTCPEMDNILMHYGAEKEKIYRHRFSSVASGDIIEHPLSDNEKNDMKLNLGFTTERLILSVGKDPEGKGFDVLIKALDKVDQTRCCIVGASEQAMDDYLTSKNIKWRNKVVNISYLSKQELAKYYQAADLFVLPTRHDVWGLVIGEAMANGIPVITTNQCVAGVNMLSQEQIVPVDDTFQLANTINLLFRNMDMLKEIARKQITVIKQYAYDEAVKDDWKNLQDFLRNKSV